MKFPWLPNLKSSSPTDIPTQLHKRHHLPPNPLPPPPPIRLLPNPLLPNPQLPTLNRRLRRPPRQPNKPRNQRHRRHRRNGPNRPPQQRPPQRSKLFRHRILLLHTVGIPSHRSFRHTYNARIPLALLLFPPLQHLSRPLTKPLHQPPLALRNAKYFLPLRQPDDLRHPAR